MIYFPWIVFVIGIALLIWQGYKARTSYLRSKELEKRQSELTLHNIALRDVKNQLRGQDQKQDPAQALVGSQQGQRPN